MHEVAGTHVALHTRTDRHTHTSNKMKLEKRRTEANKQGRNYRNNNNNKNRFKTRMPEFLLSLNGTSWEIQWDIPEIIETNKQKQTNGCILRFWKPNKSQVEQFKRDNPPYTF